MQKSIQMHFSVKFHNYQHAIIGHTFFGWVFLYSMISFIYRQVLLSPNYEVQRQMFELVCVYANRFLSIIPLTFLVGFYVSQVVSRWWDQFMSLPWPDYLALKLANFCPGHVSIISICQIQMGAKIYSSVVTVVEVCSVDGRF